MKMVVLPLILQLVKLCVIGFAFTVLGSTGHDIPPSPANLSVISPVEGTPGVIHHRKSLRSHVLSSASEPYGSNFHPPNAIPPIPSAPMPQIIEGLAPSLSPSTPIEVPPYNTAPPLLVFHEHGPSLPPIPPLLSPPPSSSPRTSVISPPPITTPPPSSSPITPVISPPANTTPPPSSSPRTSVIPPLPNTTPPPSSSPRTPVISPPANTTPPPSLSPRAPVISPPPNSTPPPSSSPRIPVIPPPPNTTPPPSLSPRTPVIPPPPNTTPPPSSSPRTPVIPPPPNTTPPPSSSPRIPVIPPPPNTTPPPSSSPRTPVISPPPNATPLPSLTPKIPVASPPPSTAPPPFLTPTTPAVSPSSSKPKIPIVSPPSYSASPPSSTPTNPLVSPPSNLAPPPSLIPTTPVVSSPSNSAPPPFIIEGLVPSTLPSAPPRKSTVSVPGAPFATPSRNSTQNSPSTHPSIPRALPPISNERNASNNKAPIIDPVAPVASLPRKSEKSPLVHPISPGLAPSTLPGPVPVSSPTSKLPRNFPDLDVPPASTPTSSFDRNKDGIPVAEPPHEMPKPLPPVSHSPTKAPSTQKPTGHLDFRVPPLPSPRSPPNKGYHSHASSPSTLLPKQHHASNKVAAPAPSYFISPTASPGPVILPGGGHRVPPPLPQGIHVSTAPSPTPIVESSQTEMPRFSPKISPSGPSTKSSKMPVLPPIRALPPPPPNADCSTTVCTEPYTNTPPGAPCGCVWPMQVGLRLSVALYTFFPLVSELAAEIAAGVFMKQSQVRIMGANAATEQPEKTVVLIDLVPLGEKFDNTTAFLTYQRFWHKQVVILSSFFGDYEVLYVRYPGLPPSPPSASSSIDLIDDGPYSGNGNNARTVRPEGVDVPKRGKSNGINPGIVVIIVLSAFVAVVVCSAIAWVLLFKYRGRDSQSAPVPGPLQQSHAKPSGATGSMTGSGLESTSLSFGSSIATYTGSAKTFSASDIERATNNFDASRVLGEGGFGRVYSGVLEDGTKVAVKVLKRDDQQGGREFLAEVEMLSRLHHRNLVKLIGICIEEHARCLVYELIPNGSVESHLHGDDKESAPLGWDARLKIALGAARGLAYLHEDSSPHVIHRDFKSSNILLEHDFTPKVADFGLARTAMDEENTHISTRVMGTFGYVAPEYAMTGHLLVKSDVYSYGVVLLELLSGRKPVDMTQLPGQENLVAWARPLLTSSDGLETIIDKSLGDDVPFDSVAKVAAIASMCVQPEVSHRPFMGEVVQALKLVSNECNEAKEMGSRSSSQDDLSIDFDARVSTCSERLPDPLQSQHSVPNYDLGLDTERGLSVSDLFSSSARYGKDESRSFRRYSSSGPLRTTGKGRQFWQNIRRLSTGSVSEHEQAVIRFSYTVELWK
ncbi:hypothetical protein Dsin_015201 [Dipteronia sinensis]|uniref:Protein kinase domain-containing protein n=1 Tax=Dipteronia sinensis TaxID=43782 RepID=A0AAE0AAV8_9ROSI|nr:hypothetical protein Dsin_015201 [Dipteronia sinensis]